MSLAEAPPVLGPPLKWAGGKRWQLPHLRPLWEPHSRRRIVEPFAAEWLAHHRGPVILVNQATARIEKLYRKLRFDIRFLAAPRRISCTGDRTPAGEILGTRNM